MIDLQEKAELPTVLRRLRAQVSLVWLIGHVNKGGTIEISRTGFPLADGKQAIPESSDGRPFVFFKQSASRAAGRNSFRVERCSRYDQQDGTLEQISAI